MIPTERFARIEVQSVEMLRAWMSTHALHSESGWLVTPLKRSRHPIFLALQSLTSYFAADHVTWIHSYVSVDKKKMSCIYDGPDEAAIGRVAASTTLPVDSLRAPLVMLTQGCRKCRRNRRQGDDLFGWRRLRRSPDR